MPLRPDILTERLAGREVEHVSALAGDRLEVHFVDGTTLLIELKETGLSASVTVRHPSATSTAGGLQPTKRQREYLRFITK